jgi:hypothetical protein
VIIGLQNRQQRVRHWCPILPNRKKKHTHKKTNKQTNKQTKPTNGFNRKHTSVIWFVAVDRSVEIWDFHLGVRICDRFQNQPKPNSKPNSKPKPKLKLKL